VSLDDDPLAKPKKKGPRKGLVIAVGIGAFLVAIVVVTNRPSSTSTTFATLPDLVGNEDPGTGSDQVIDRIEATSDCNALQREFDTASRNHDIQSENGNLELMKLTTRYMVAADRRMQKLGCYG
jgi:hypothetical protein